jgi:choline-sulfatase
MKRYALDVGPGESPYTRQDRNVADAACTWLREQAPNCTKPWVLYAGFVLPHFPLIAPPEFWELYPPPHMPLPRLYAPEDVPTHPVLKALKECWCYDDYFDENSVRAALASYYAVVSYLDHNIGRVLRTLEECGFAEDTRIIYTSDHGDTLGNRRMWGKSTMYEESVGVPMIMAGPDVPEGQVVSTPVSLVDIYPTVVESAGGSLSAEERQLPGRSLIRIANGETSDRAVLSEYHAAGAITGFYMLRWDRWKYVYYVGYPPQLFDLESDPDEAIDLAEDAEYREIIARCEARLREIVDPEATNVRAFRDQGAKIAAHGGFEAIEKASRELQALGFTPPPEDIPGLAPDGARQIR